MSHPFTYRPDIDGLRAVAVMAVLLFHGGVSSISGGYVGVDVFFVISGYLITSIIVSKVDKGSFSLIDFWERRVRRIIPPLMVVALFALIGSWWLLFPDDYKDFSESLFAITVFASNFLFFTEAGYFAGPGELKPLLHTWSLAIEEQFYLLFPFLMMALAGGRARFRVLVIGGLAIISLLLSHQMVKSAPEAAFFLLPARAWELSIGALLVFIRLSNSAPGWLREVLSMSGLVMIIYTCLVYTKETRFPGISALLPCIGTGFIIFSQSPEHKTWCYKLLALKPVIFVGLLSYSLYLWHWPLLVFVRYHTTGEENMMLNVAAMAASFVLAYFSWRFVEGPIRRGEVFKTRKSVFVAALVAAVICIGIGLAGHLSNGFPNRFEPEVLSIYSGHEYYNQRRGECLNPHYMNFNPERVCTLGDTNSQSKPAFLAVGDSHANSMMPLLDQLSAQKGIPGLFAGYNGCPPMLGVYRYDTGDLHNCDAFNRAVIERVRKESIDNVLLLGRWAFYPEDRMIGALDANGKRPENWLSKGKPPAAEARAAFEQGLEGMIAELSKTANVTLLLQVPLQDEHTSPRYLASRKWQGDELNTLGISVQDHTERQKRVNAFIRSLAEKPQYRLTLLDPTPYLCGVNEADKNLCPVVREGGAVYRDDDHVSTFGSQYMAPLFDDFYRRVAE